MSAIATMSSKGQLTIPKEIREQLNLSEGTRFFVTVRDGEVIARPKNRPVTDLAGILSDVSAGRTTTLEDYDEAVGRGLAEDDERIVRQWNERNGSGR